MKSNLILMSILLFFSTVHSMKRDSDNDSNKRVIKKQKINVYDYAQEEMHEYTAIDHSITEPNNNDQQDLSLFDRLPLELVLIIFENCILANIDQSFDNPDFEKLENEADLISENGINKFQFLLNAIYTCNHNIQNCIISFANRDIDFNGYFHQNLKKNVTLYFKTQFVKKLKSCISNTNIYQLLQNILTSPKERRKKPDMLAQIFQIHGNSPINQFIIEILLLARNNAIPPKDKKVIPALQALLSLAMAKQYMSIIHLLMDNIILKTRNTKNSLVNLNASEWLLKDSKNINIIKTLIDHNHLRKQMISLVHQQFYPKWNYAKKSYDPLMRLHNKIAPNIAQLFLNLLPVNTIFHNTHSLLMIALYFNDITTIKKIMNSNVDFKFLNNNQQTALHLVQCLDNEEDALDVAQNIILNGKFDASDIKKPDEFHYTPIDYAFLKYYRGLAIYLLQKANPDQPEILYPPLRLISLAVRHNRLKLLEEFINKDNVNTVYSDGFTPLMVAAFMCNDIELIILLLSVGADITFMDNEFKSTLSYLFEFIKTKIRGLTYKPNDKEKLLKLKGILFQRLEEIKNTNLVNPRGKVTMFQEFLEKNIN